VIKQAILNGGARGHSGGLPRLCPVEADPADWVEQQQSVPLADDEYPQAGGDRRFW
jgi:hypothetical protein